MKVAESRYIAGVRVAMDTLERALAEEFPYASVLLQDTFGRRYTVSAGGINVAVSAMNTGRGGVVRVHDGRGYGEYSFSALSADEVPAIMAGVRAMLPLSGGDPLPGYVEPVEFHKATECGIDPQKMDSGEIIRRLTELRRDAMAVDERVMDCMIMFEYQVIHKRFASGGRRLEQDILWSSAAMNVMARRGEEIKEYYRSFSMLGGAEILDRIRGGVMDAVKGVIDLLDSEPMAPGEYECVCAPDVTGMIVHEAFGHGVEMDMFVKKRAQAEQYVGKYVASPLVTMHDTACGREQTATYFFDDEGTIAEDTVIIEEGVLKKGICDRLSAERLAQTPTGNGRRESFERKAYTRMTNTYFEGGTDSVEDMIASIKYGFLLENASSGMEDPKNWGIQLMVNMAREIRDGKLTGKVFSPVVMTGYVPDLLKSISMMSPDVRLEGGGACGKGYKEWVKVSDGGPYMKARIRLG